MSVLLAILAAIAVLGPLVALHEWGHYIVARLCGVKVLTYSIGFGPKLWTWKSKKTGIDYAISAIPLGGYVKMLDEREGEVAESERHLAFNNQHPLKKIAIVAAGPLMNFIIAIFLFWILFMTPSEQLNTRVGRILPDSPVATQLSNSQHLKVGDKIVAIDGHSVQTWEEINYRLADRMGESSDIKVSVIPYQNDKPTQQQADYSYQVKDFMQGNDKGKDALSSLGVIPWQPNIPAVVGELSPDGAAIRQGMKEGDKIIAINDEPIDDWVSATYIIRQNPEKLLTFIVLRNHQPVTLHIMPQGKKDNMGHVYGQIGVAGVPPEEVVVPDTYKTTVEYQPIQALGKAFAKTEQLAVMTLSSMGKMISGMIGLDNLSGPITIAQVAKHSFEISWEMVLSTTALISLSLAVLNLLPIPVLDGGHLLYYTIELIRGKPVSERVQMIGLNIGFILLAGFMILAIGNDLSRLF